jgi:hypothetical protein
MGGLPSAVDQTLTHPNTIATTSATAKSITGPQYQCQIARRMRFIAASIASTSSDQPFGLGRSPRISLNSFGPGDGVCAVVVLHRLPMNHRVCRFAGLPCRRPSMRLLGFAASSAALLPTPARPGGGWPQSAREGRPVVGAIHQWRRDQAHAIDALLGYRCRWRGGPSLFCLFCCQKVSRVS